MTEQATQTKTVQERYDEIVVEIVREHWNDAHHAGRYQNLLYQPRKGNPEKKSILNLLGQDFSYYLGWDGEQLLVAQHMSKFYERAVELVELVTAPDYEPHPQHDREHPLSAAFHSIHQTLGRGLGSGSSLFRMAVYEIEQEAAREAKDMIAKLDAYARDQVGREELEALCAKAWLDDPYELTQQIQTLRKSLDRARSEQSKAKLADELAAAQDAHKHVLSQREVFRAVAEEYVRAGLHYSIVPARSGYDSHPY